MVSTARCSELPQCYAFVSFFSFILLGTQQAHSVQVPVYFRSEKCLSIFLPLNTSS
jgi:hypothetical protein